MPPSSRSINYDALLSLTLDNYRDQLVDNIFSSNAFLSAIYGGYGKKRKKGKGIRVITGGDKIRTQLLYGQNSTAKSYSGYDVLDTTPQEGITTAFFDWRQLAVSITISGAEEAKNRGQAKIKSLLEAKTMQAEMSLLEELNKQLICKGDASSNIWSAGNGEKDLDPLFGILPKDPTGSTEIGNIDQSSYSWWRPVTVDGSHAHSGRDAGAERGFAVTTWETQRAAMRYTYNACNRGAGGSPDLVLTDQLSYESYEAGLDNRSRIVNNSNGPVSAGFESVRFKGADMIFDEFMPDVDGGYAYDSSSWSTGTMAFLNLDFLEFVIESSRDFVSTGFVRPQNQDARTAQILTMGNLTVSNRKKQGLLYGMQASITS